MFRPNVIKPEDKPFSSLKNKSVLFKPVNSGLSQAEFDDNKNVVLNEGGKKIQFSENGKPEFISADKLESVIEYSGEATDSNNVRSLGYAKFPPKGHSTNHCHHERDEEYLITKGHGLLIKKNLEGQSINLILKAGDVAAILKGEEHQIFNLGEEELELIVWCKPSFSYADFHVHPSNDVSLFGSNNLTETQGKEVIEEQCHAHSIRK